VGLRDRLTGIDTNLDDLQSGVDAGSRQADRIQKAAASIERLQLEPPAGVELVGSLVRHTTELQACVRDQRAALHELRTTVAQLRNELTGSNAAPVRSPSGNAVDRQRR
jgi:small ligand-binding sensory domain FIST